MFRKSLIAILALLIASGTAFAKPRALQPAVAVSAEFKLSQKTKATRFRVSRPIMVRNPELGPDTEQRAHRNSSPVKA